MYYAGGYYAGGYYAGGVFSFLGKVVKAGVSVASGALAGFKFGPAGVIAGGAAGAARAITSGVHEETLAAGGSESALTPELIAKHRQALLRGGSGGGVLKPTTALPVTMGGGMGLMVPGMHFRRLHPNKTTYITRGGGTSRWPVGIQVHPKGTEAIPSRRMNVANPRALRRALRRAHGFARLARRYVTVVRHFKRKGRKKK